MSWVITRRLLKSGGNNIYWRIGNYNKYSSMQCQTLRKIYTSIPTSKRYKRFRKNIDQSLYNNIDKYIYKKISIFNINLPSHSNNNSHWCTVSDGCFSPPPSNKFLNSWCKYYTNTIADKIFRRCVVKEDIMTKYNNEYLKISADKMFTKCIVNIINKYHKYKSFSNIEPDYYGWKPDLFRSCQRECSRRWNVELLD